MMSEVERDDLSMPTLLYDEHDVRLYHGDVRALTALLPLESAAAIITDPPYALYRYIRELYESQHLEPREDAGWQREVFYWAVQWWFPVRSLLRPDGCLWLFCDLNYMGMYVRLATLIGYPMRQMYVLSDHEFLLYCAPTRLDPAVARRVAEACTQNTYGSGKSATWLRALVDASPEGLVIDPFCGHGGALVAAQAAGRPAVGIEIDADIVEIARQALGG